MGRRGWCWGRLALAPALGADGRGARALGESGSCCLLLSAVTVALANRAAGKAPGRLSGLLVVSKHMAEMQSCLGAPLWLQEARCPKRGAERRLDGREGGRVQRGQREESRLGFQVRAGRCQGCASECRESINGRRREL